MDFLFVRTENFYTFRRNYPIVTSIVAIHLLAFVWIHFLPGGKEYIYGYGVGYNAAVAAGEYWRLITPIFLHVGIGHLIFNSFSLVIFGPALEQMLGRIKFIIAYLLAGIVANLATFFVGGLAYPTHLGASGAIFGLLGVYVYVVIFRKDLIDQANAQLVTTIVVIGLIMTFVNSNINIIAHLFGFIAGLALAPIFLAGVTPYARYQVIHKQKEVSFDPQRWHKKKRASEKTKKIIWGIFVLLVICGIIARFM